MKVVVTSDTHFPFDDLLIEDGDVLIHTGDLMMAGHLGEWPERLSSLQALPHKTKILVPGNHDGYIFRNVDAARFELEQVGVTLLGAQGCPIHYKLPNGRYVTGVPYLNNLPGWSFNTDPQVLRGYCQWVVESGCQLDVAIVATHSPPRGIGDINGWGADSHLLLKLNPEYWVFGHIHETYGEHRSTVAPTTRFINAAMCNRKYEQRNPAISFEL